MTMDRPIPRSRGVTRRRLLAVVAITALAVLIWALSPSLARWLQSEASVDRNKIRLGTAVHGDLVHQIAVDGRITAAFFPTQFSPTSGIVHIACRAGEGVERGQLLGRVEAPELKNRLLQAQQRLVELASSSRRQRLVQKQQELQREQRVGLLEVELEAAERALGRAKQSVALGVLSAVEFERAEDRVRVLSLQVRFAREENRLASQAGHFEAAQRNSAHEQQQLVVAEIQRQVDALQIRSPVSGQIARLHVEDREAVVANAPLFTVVDLSAFEVEIAVAESYAHELVAGTEAIVAFGTGSYPGRVKSLSPEIQGGRVKGVVAFTGKIPMDLKQHQRVAVQLVLASQADVLKVPRGAFLESGSGHAYVIEDGLAVLRPITIGQHSLSEVEIVSGLKAGEQLIVSDTSRFSGAKRVLLRN